MTDESTDQTYEQLTQAAMAGDLPQPEPVCKDCAVQAIPFAVQRDDKRDVDRVLGIPSFEGAATIEWFGKNRWIRDRVQNFRDTYLLRVLDSFGAQFGDAALAKLSASLRRKGIELVSLDFEMDQDDYVTPAFLGEVTAARFERPNLYCDKGNFVFRGNRVYFWSFTSASFADATPVGPNGERGLPDFSLQVFGQYDPAQAARDLMANFQRAEEVAENWTKFWGAVNTMFGVLALVPLAGVVTTGIAGTFLGVRYALAILDGALAVNSVASGIKTMIKGQDIDLGEEFFADLGKLANPKNGEERGRQVFMFINFAMIARDIGDGARWIVRSIRKDTTPIARYDVETLSDAERKRIQDRDSADLMTVEVRKTHSIDPHTGEGGDTYSAQPSHDTPQFRAGNESLNGKADYAVMTRTQRENLVLGAANLNGCKRTRARLNKVVGDAGEEALAEMLVEKLGVKPERIPGYSSDRRIAPKLGLQNRSGHGLDLMVWVPPPPSLTVRRAEGRARHEIEGASGVATPTETLRFEEDTLLIFESKSTLGLSGTPGFNSTQNNGGSKKVADLLGKIRVGRQGWNETKMIAFDPAYLEKLNAIDEARRTDRVQYLHAQIFFDSKGILKPQVGAGTGIQLNIW